MDHNPPMHWNLLLAALLASTLAKPPLQVEGCALLANPAKFDGKIVQFIAHRMPALETLDFAPFGCGGKIGITEPVIMHDHRLPLEGAHRSRAGFMIPATRIEGRVRLERALARQRFKAMTFLFIDNSTLEPAGYRPVEAAARRR